MKSRTKSGHRTACSQRRRRLAIEPLENRIVLAGGPIITEFVASNTSGLKDGYGDDSDWIEIRNDSDSPIDLMGYHLTDDAADLNKWRFATSSILNPGQYLVVFASGRGIPDPAGHFHTTFQLAQDGEYLALTGPDQSILSEFGSGTANYPAQISNLSYGVSGAQLIGPESLAEYWIPADDSLGTTWVDDAFDGPANGFVLGRAAIGYENTPGNATSYVGSFLTAVPSGTTNVYQRIAFNVDVAALVNDLRLEMNYDDGFIVYLNGTMILGENVPDPIGYNTPATANHDDALALAGTVYDLDSRVGLLRDGQNILAIHALNRPNSSDFLSVPRLSSDSISGETGYLSQPTPGAANAELIELGPIISEVHATATVAQVDQPLTIVTNVIEFGTALAPDTVRLHYRVMYDNEIALPMRDDGFGVDAVAGDGNFSAEIPGSAFVAGQMIRWRVTAADTEGTQTREPRFLDALDSPEYFGTVVADNGIGTDLPVLQWFLANPSAASTDAGTRASLFVGGEFYDNISVNNHGQSTRGSAFPKKSFDFDSNSGNKFRIKPELNRVSDFNLLTNYADQTKLRNTLMYDLFSEADYAHHFAFSVMVYRNGTFYGLYDLVEEGDTEYLSRLGLDPDNALYKVNNRLDSASNQVEKKSREYEDHADFQQVVDAAQTLSGTAAQIWDYDHLDIADLVNYLAIHNVAVSSDFGHKNMYWYRDTNGTGLWSVFPWDQDLSLGHQWDASVTPPYFKDALVTDLSIFLSGNNIFQRAYSEPNFRAMYLRRLRTLADQFYGVSGSLVQNSYLAQNITRLEALIAQEAVQDAEQWGIHANFTHTPAQAAAQLTNEFIPLRRSYLEARPEIPDSQFGTPNILFDDVDYDADPISGSQNEEYIRLNNPGTVAVDISGWRIDGGIDHRFKGGTVIPAGGSLYVVKDVVAFQNRATGPRAGARLFIQGNYSGQLSYVGETVDLISDKGVLVDTLEVPAGNPTTNQQFLRITEIHYHPVATDTEFIEFTNISDGGVATTLDLSGVSIVDGPSVPFVFPPGTTLAPGERLLVVSDAASMLANYPTLNAASIAGTYLGSLSNGGERLKVIDVGAETILDLDYGDSDPWAFSPDGAGASLVLIDPVGTPLARLSKPYSWRGSAEFGGSPAAESFGLRGVVINELLTHTDPPQSDSIELFNTADVAVDISGWYLSDSRNDLLKFRIPLGTVLAAGGYVTFTEDDFNPNPSTPGPNDFALSGSQGEEVWLVVADATETAVGEFVDQVAIGAAFNGQSFGRLPNGSGRLAPLAELSLGAVNGLHASGEIVISEVHYHPDEPNPTEIAIEPAIRSADFEFVELYNQDSQAADLSNWRLRGDVDFDLVAGTTLAAGATLVVVPFDPEFPGNANRLVAFRTRFGIDAAVRLIGPFAGSLGNSFGRVELEKPDQAPADDPTVMPRVTFDEVVYDDLVPWPNAADGMGNSLHRVSESTFGHAAQSWSAALANPGTTRFRPRVVSVRVNDGDAQRSIVTSLTIEFDRPTNVDIESFEVVNRISGQSVGGLFIDTGLIDGRTIATITFATGPQVHSRTSGHSLIDGDYRLRVFPLKTHAEIGGAEMETEFDFGEASSDRFFRRFGDRDGDGDVDGEDYGRFGMTFLKLSSDAGFDSAFDFDGDGDVDGWDYGRFRNRR